MIPFETLTAVAAPFPKSDIDIDVIFPARFLLLLDKVGLGKLLFMSGGSAAAGPGPSLCSIGHPTTRRASWSRRAVSRPSGPSRITGYGASSRSASISFANCFKNSVLPIVLQPDPRQGPGRR